MDIETKRISEREQEGIEGVGIGNGSWDKWGPYVAERGWGTVREDYSANGDAWNYFTHHDARFRAYRRAEDGIAGISDRFQVLLFAPSFWNGVDPILKERLFGLNAWEGNHGEDVKEYYYYLDATPTHSYLKYLYKYPQSPFPYQQLLEENQRAGVLKPEYELMDTGVFREDRYFDIFIEYAKIAEEDLCIRIEAINRGPASAPLHILPTLWFRNQWSWKHRENRRPIIKLSSHPEALDILADDKDLLSPKYLLFDYHLGTYHFYGPLGGEPLFTENDTNQMALWGQANESPFTKEAFHSYLIEKKKEAVNPAHRGTKAGIHYFFPEIGAGQSQVLFFRLSKGEQKHPLVGLDDVFKKRKEEADAFYETVLARRASAEEKEIQRQAFAGMIWTKQSYIFSVGDWLQGDPKFPPPEGHKHVRNTHWRHLVSMRIISMPDKWEYPWFAAWDLTFHALTFALFDLAFAKNQLWILLFDQFQHPNGAIPAYEWEFSDINPPVQAWAALKIFNYEAKTKGKGDHAFLEKCFHKLLLNFSWWVNRVDQLGNNVFEGGFLGMDNLGFSDRSEKLAPGYLLDQADGAGWMCLLCLNLMRIALELAKEDKIYEALGIKFFQHYIYVTAAMRKGYWRSYDMWSEKEGFFHSFLRHPDGKVEEIPVRSLVGVVPFFALDFWSEEELKQFPDFYYSYKWVLEKRSHLTEKCVHIIEKEGKKHFLFCVLNPDEMRRFLTHVWDEEEFRSPYGLRSLSKYHEKNPAKMQNLSLGYEPGESKEKIKGGNSNWRGPIWFPANYLLIDRLLRLGDLLGDSFQVTVPGQPPVNPRQMAEGFSENLLRLFTRNQEGKRPFLGDHEKLQNDPHFKDYILFYEHFHGDTGRGLGAAHQTGWTGLIANLIQTLRG